MHSLGFFAPSSLSHFSLTMFVPPCVPHVHDSDGPARWASMPPRNPSPRFFLHEANSRPSSTNIKSPRSRRLFRAGHNISKCFQRDRSSLQCQTRFFPISYTFPIPTLSASIVLASPLSTHPLHKPPPPSFRGSSPVPRPSSPTSPLLSLSRLSRAIQQQPRVPDYYEERSFAAGPTVYYTGSQMGPPPSSRPAALTPAMEAFVRQLAAKGEDAGSITILLETEYPVVQGQKGVFDWVKGSVGR